MSSRPAAQRRKVKPRWGRVTLLIRGLAGGAGRGQDRAPEFSPRPGLSPALPSSTPPPPRLPPTNRAQL